MNKVAHVLLVSLALAAIYCAIPKTSNQVAKPPIGAQQVVLVADGSDPMPLCKGKVCK